MGQGSPSKLNKIGYNYLHGIEVEKDENMAFIYFQKSAEMEDADGTNNVGYCYEKGIGVEKDEHKAFVYYQKSAEMGNTGGTYNVGCCYEKGIGVEKDWRKSFIYYQKSAEMRNTSGTYNVGCCYQYGIGVKKDENKAFIYIQKSAEMGHAKGIHKLGYFYVNGIGVEKDEYKAFINYQKLAEMGNANGIYYVGCCYQYGIGVVKDENKAFINYQKSAEMGDTNAMSQLEYCYRNGIGTQIDIQKANHWFQTEKNNPHEFIKSTHENLEIDNVVKELLEDNRCQLTWFPYNEFKNIKKIGQGYYATVYSANWIKETAKYNTTVTFALKKIHDQNYLYELKAYCEIENPSFLKCHGISRDEMGNYILVLKYATMGSLNKNLSSIAKMRWKDKLKLLYCITSDLVAIHSLGYAHQDLHSGNILQDDLYSAYIVDLGHSNMSKKLGIEHYFAPEVLMDYEKFTLAADVYSLGVIMTEISTGKQAFEGLDFVSGTPDCYVRLAKRCMDPNPNKRPTAKSVNYQVGFWNQEMLSSDDDNEIKSQFLEIDNTLQVIDTDEKNLYPISNLIDFIDIHKFTK